MKLGATVISALVVAMVVMLEGEVCTSVLATNLSSQNHWSADSTELVVAHTPFLAPLTLSGSYKAPAASP